MLSDNEAAIIIETLIDTLIEVGNGVTDDDLHAQVDEMLRFRDKWLNHKIKK